VIREVLFESWYLTDNITTAYGCLILTTVLVACCPDEYDGPGNAVSCVVLACGYTIGTIITNVHNDLDMDGTDILMAIAKANFAVAMGAISVLSKDKGVLEKGETYLFVFPSMTPIIFLFVLLKCHLHPTSIKILSFILWVAQTAFVLMSNTAINVQERWVAEKCRTPWVFYLLTVTVCVVR
jgi:hypothetical protein